MNVDLRCNYLGLPLSGPIAASAGPLTGKIETLLRLEEAGASAVVLPSLFEEQLVHEEIEQFRLHELHSHSFAEGLSMFVDPDEYNSGPGDYLELIETARKRLKIPVIASLNGVSKGGWTSYAKRMAEAGASALELNIYFVPTDPSWDAADVENRYIELVADVRQAVSIPIAVKIGPYFSSLPHFAKRITEAGAGGLVLFNRYLHPEIDLETLAVKPHLALSTREESLLSLRWIAILRGQFSASLGASSGVHHVHDVLKLLLAGADLVFMTSALLKAGPGLIETLLRELRDWLESREYASVRQLQGSLSRQHSPDPSAFERANYMQALIAHSRSWGG